MRIAAHPEDETQRIASLKSIGLLDTPTDLYFDQLTVQAAHIFNTPICAVSIIDSKRQWFKSIYGLDVCETGRDEAFCSHVVHDHKLLEVRNALEHPDFHDNPLVIGAPNIRFYCGTPIHDTNGFCLGSFCVIDKKPRQFTEEQKELLNSFALQAEALIALHVRQKITKRKTERLLVHVIFFAVNWLGNQALYRMQPLPLFGSVTAALSRMLTKKLNLYLATLSTSL